MDVIPIEKSPQNTNILNSKVQYKLKRYDGKLLALKVIRSPHRNEDRDEDILTTGFQTCSPACIIIVLLVKFTVCKSFALSTGEAPLGNEDRDEHIPTTDCETCSPAIIRIVMSAESIRHGNAFIKDSWCDG